MNILFVESDWKGTEKWNNLEKELATIGVKVFYLPHTDGISTTELKNKMHKAITIIRRKVMEVTRDVAMKLWNDIFGEKLWAQDCYGTWMYRDDYGLIDKTRNNRPNGTGKYYNYCWEVDHIRPKSSFKDENDANFYNNFEPVQSFNNREKADGYPSFLIGNNKYKIVECEICERNGEKGYGILNLSTGKRIDWKFVKNMYYGK